MSSTLATAVALASLLAGGYFSGNLRLQSPLVFLYPDQPDTDNEGARWRCDPFLPNLFEETPPPTDHPAIRAAIESVDQFFASRFAEGDIDSLSVAVITADGPLYEGNFGVTRGNETGSPLTTRHSSYRISSTGKIFTVLEGLLLEQKGIISWDDPVDKYLTNFTYRIDGLDAGPQSHPDIDEEPPITLFQLASHMSGLGRDWPAGTVSNWPHDMFGGGPPPTNGHPFPTNVALMNAIAHHSLTSPPWFYPAYSNAGTGSLGLALAAASSAATGDSPVISYAELLKRDVFEPLGMNGSHFLTTEANKHLVIVPSLAPEVADQDFLDAMNPAGGQFSSLSDLITVTQTLLNPRHPLSLLSRSTRDRWLRTTAHAFEEDDWTELGLMWEIIKAPDSYGRLRKIYWKLGAMAGYHSALAIHPGTSYAIVLLMAGHYPDAAQLTYDAFALMQPAIDRVLSDMAIGLYAGEWRDKHNSSARVVVDKGTLYVERYMLEGVDALQKFGAQGRLALRPSGRRDEFRLDTGIPGYNGKKHMGCYPYWNGQDLWGVRNNAAINALYFSGSGDARRLHVPSLSIVMKRA
ncbi:beta-lactamase/transpeptidase-like protein [Cubamyces sp. BRFM 1775]|nr:beta-lactamase/transpeptidase-like protein [Cubamyces sp. BRFM 1775]